MPTGPELALLERVFAAPNDDAPRLVLADWLLDQGDPRGEFITLQFRQARHEATVADRRRAYELERAFRAQWLGPALTKVLDPARCRFDRGFLSVLALRPDARAADLRALVGLPGLSTVSALALSGLRRPEVLEAEYRLLRSPILSGLRTLGLSRGSKDAVVESRFGSDELSAELDQAFRGALSREPARVPEGLPPLEELAVACDGAHAQVLEGLGEAPMLRQLVRLDLRLVEVSDPFAAARLRDFTLGVGHPLSARVVEVGLTSAQWTLESLAAWLLLGDGSGTPRRLRGLYARSRTARYALLRDRHREFCRLEIRLGLPPAPFLPADSPPTREPVGADVAQAAALLAQLRPAALREVTVQLPSPLGLSAPHRDALHAALRRLPSLERVELPGDQALTGRKGSGTS